jgi:hypothetical protein
MLLTYAKDVVTLFSGCRHLIPFKKNTDIVKLIEVYK